MKDVKTVVLAALVSASPSGWSAHPQNLFNAEVRTTCVTTNSTGGLAHKHYGNRQIIAQAAAASGISNRMGLRLVFSRTADDLEVVSGTNNTVIATPFTFSGGVSLSKTNGTVTERLSWVFPGTNRVAAGTLRATEFSQFGTNNQLTGFALLGRLQFATPASGTNRAAIYSGRILAGRFRTLEHEEEGEEDGD